MDYPGIYAIAWLSLGVIVGVAAIIDCEPPEDKEETE